MKIASALKATAVFVSLLALPLSAAIPISTTTPAVQTFDGIGTAATATLPPDFRLNRPATVRTVGTFASAATATTAAGGANLSSSASNGAYNFGSGTTTTGGDRAIGFLSSGSATASGNLYAQLVNSSGVGLSGIRLSYDVEKYRMGINPNGFRFQLFYSTDGSNWTNAGPDFLTHFAVDPGTANSGYTTAPGAVVAITAKTLPVSIGPGASLYLAWNYSVSATNTATNAQALAIDNISILGLEGTGPTNPSGTGFATPATVNVGASTLLTVNVNPGTGPASTGIVVTANLTAIGGSSFATFTDAGDNRTFTYSATVALGTSTGLKSLPVTIGDAQGRPASTSIALTVEQPVGPVDHIVISQVYGGGGNGGATFRNDYVELFNPTLAAVNLGGWSLQYSPADGDGWAGLSQPIGGIIAPGEYFLIALSSGGAVGASLPAANIDGGINISATAGKLALVRNGEALEGDCPLSDADLVDFVGYGSASSDTNCREGAANAPAPSNTSAIFRKSNGFVDTNQNGADFVTGVPNPRRTAPIVEIGPSVFNTNPRINGSNAPRDESIIVNFTEAVEVSGSWYDITCASGQHNDATVAAGGFRSWVITPNQNFVPGESCTVTIFAANVRDTDTNDSDPGTDTLSANYSWTFTVATGAAPPYSSDVHLAMGMPAPAFDDVNFPNNYLMSKGEFTLSYNNERGTPNWVSWHLADEWIGTLTRVDTFRPDPAIPPTAPWYRVLGSDYQNSGYDRGHMVPNADRDKETSIPINQATFLMTNMIPQAPDNNQGPWANMENYLRTLSPANEMYIVAGGAGTIGTIPGKPISIPASTWKVVLVLPKGIDDVNRVSASTRTIAVIMPNIQGIRTSNTSDWMGYITTVDAVEALTGYNFFSNVSDAVENAIEAGTNGSNPPGVTNQSSSGNEDAAQSITLEAASGGSVTYTIVTGPSHGTLSGSGANQTYTPAPDYNGSDSFTFRANDGTRSSNTATVTITVLEVNDAPAAANDSQSTNEDQTLTFPAVSLTANDSTGLANESSQTLTVTEVTATADTHGTVALSSGQVSYVPAANYHGPASFSYRVCDNGVTRGLTDPLCTTATVLVDVASVNDAPSVTLTAPATSVEGSAVSVSATVTDSDAGESFTYAWTATKNGAPYATGTGTSFSFTPDDNGAYAVTLNVADSNGGTGTGSASVAVANAAPVIAAVSGPTAPIAAGGTATISVSYTDAGSADTHTAAFVWDDGSTSTAACAAGVCTGTRAYSAAGTYGVAIIVTDDDGATASTRFDFVVVYDANEGFVTGGGWIDSATGKTQFNVNAKYQKNRTEPAGNTQLKAADLDFKSTSYDWLVIAGSAAQYQGTGTVNGAGSYGFLLTVTDGQVDRFRMKIWDKSTGAVVYDNVAGSSDDIDAANPQAIGSGSIVIHAK